MKEIMAVIRPKKVEETKNALEKMGFPSMTAVSVLGRGRQRGIAGEVNIDIRPERLSQGKSGGMKYVPKRLLTLAVRDRDVNEVVETLIRINQTGAVGDGKIFVCPLENAIRLRTDEEGDEALDEAIL
jgi:nitrogen regulatory protein PII 2